MMTEIFSMLSEEELDHLDNFLLERIDDDTDTTSKDEGILDVSELDGFFVAIISGPVLIQPSQWLPAIWGDFEPVWESEQEFQDIFSLMVRHMNGIAGIFMERPEDFEPLFLEREVKGKCYTLVDDWCSGYLRGVALDSKQWDQGGQAMRGMLMPMTTFASEDGWQLLEKFSNAEVEKIQQKIPPAVCEIHAYWLAKRQGDKPSASPIRRESPRVGRNDPCPCGSGKKYKKCCLH